MEPEHFVERYGEYIPKKDLVPGAYYVGEGRNSNVAEWDEEKEEFVHIRYKFGFRIDTAKHPEDDDGFALFFPMRKIDTELKPIK